MGGSRDSSELASAKWWLLHFFLKINTQTNPCWLSLCLPACAPPHRALTPAQTHRQTGLFVRAAAVVGGFGRSGSQRRPLAPARPPPHPPAALAQQQAAVWAAYRNATAPQRCWPSPGPPPGWRACRRGRCRRRSGSRGRPSALAPPLPQLLQPPAHSQPRLLCWQPHNRPPTVSGRQRLCLGMLPAARTIPGPTAVAPQREPAPPSSSCRTAAASACGAGPAAGGCSGGLPPRRRPTVVSARPRAPTRPSFSPVCPLLSPFRLSRPAVGASTTIITT